MKKIFIPLLLLFVSNILTAQYTVSATVTQVQVTGWCDLDGWPNGDSDAQWALDVSDNRNYSESFDHEAEGQNGPTITVTSGFDNPLNYNNTYTNECPPNFLLLDFSACDDDDGGTCGGILDEAVSTLSTTMSVPLTAGTVTNTFTLNNGACSGNIVYSFTVQITTSGTAAYICADAPCLAATQTIQDGCSTPTIFETNYDVSNSTSTYPSSLFGGCGGNSDIFFQFVAPTSGEILINMGDFGDFGATFSLTDLTMNLMEGSSCSSLAPVDTEVYTSTDVTNVSADCINMSGGLLNDDYTPIYLDGLTAGQTYYLRVTEDDDQNAEMDLSFQAIVENDFCADAIELTGTDSFTACNFNATDREEPDTGPWTAGAHTGTFAGGAVQTCSVWASNENMVWYTFEVSANTPQPISITAESVSCVGGAGTLQLGVWYQGTAAACDIAAMQGVGCAVGTNTDLTVTLPNNVPTGTYYVAMDGNAGAFCTWEFTSDQILPTCPTTPSATVMSSTSICSGGTVNVDLAFAVPGFGGAIGQFDLTASPSTGVVFSSGPNDIAEGTETITFPANQTCAPIQYAISANAKCSDGSDIANDPASIVVTVYPMALSVVTTDDGSSCGTPTVELQSAAGIACEAQSGIGTGSTAAGSCSLNGDALNYDFSATATVTALSAAPTACALPALTGTITCNACVNCSIDNLAAGTQSTCDSNLDTYTQEITITFTDAPASGDIDVNGQTFAIGTSPQTITLTDLVADGNPVNVTAFFTADPSCTLSANNLFTAPTTCVSCTDGIQNGQETGLDCGGPSCPTCPVCTVSQYYSGFVNGGIYQTANTIGSSALVINGTDVTFLASCINLDPMFEVQLGAEFLANPVPCIPFAPVDNTTSLQQEDIITHTVVSNEGQIALNYFLPENDTVELTIQSIDGSFTETLYKEAKIKGQHLVQITPNTLDSGVYMLILKTAKGEKIERVVIP